MPDGSADQISDRQTAAIVSVDNFILRNVGGERLRSRDLERYHQHGYTLGWRVRVNFSDGSCRELHILANGAFPYVAPRIAIPDGPEVLVWPHLERDGLLCILPTDAAVSVDNPARVVELVLGEACRLIEESIACANSEDFRKEFLSYWLLAADGNAARFISLIEPDGPGRRVLVWHGKSVRVVADDRQTLNRWLKRWGARAGKGQDYSFHEGLLIWLPAPLLPAEYPGTASDVHALARDASPDAAIILEELAALRLNEIDVFLGARAENGACFGGVTIRRPKSGDGLQKKGDPLIAGFRPGHVPRKLLVSRYLSGAAKVTRAPVERADHLWIHGRDHDSRQERLRNFRVAILGCGSVGGPLARLLAQAGVGNFLLVDCGLMDWPNVGRHELGAASVDRYKALELAREIEQAYPHLGDVVARHDKFGPETIELVEELANCDLIVSALGNWAAECFLNDVQRERVGFPPILYGWVESNASAAHSVHIPRGEACLQCGVDDKGRPNLTVTHWEGEDILQEPACGALYTPYGPAELCWAHALIAEHVIDAIIGEADAAAHRVWIGKRTRVEAAGGAWSEKWLKEVGDPGAGGMTIERTWPTASNCPVCARQMRAA